MTTKNVVMVGGPDSGKTNYLARLWASLRAKSGALVAVSVPSDIKYVEDALAHLLQGHFAPRTDKNQEEEGHSFVITVRSSQDDGAEPVDLVVPDVSGELWKSAVETSELPVKWGDALREAGGALLFVRVGSNQNVSPLDWVTTAKLLALPVMGESGARERPIPTQVALCELLRLLEHSLVREENRLPRVAVLVTAWDRLDAHRAKQGPLAYIADEYPLLAGRMADIDKLEVRVFGVSVVGGDFVDGEFMNKYADMQFDELGYVVEDGVGQIADLSVPLAWVATGPL